MCSSKGISSECVYIEFLWYPLWGVEYGFPLELKQASLLVPLNQLQRDGPSISSSHHAYVLLSLLLASLDESIH